MMLSWRTKHLNSPDGWMSLHCRKQSYRKQGVLIKEHQQDQSLDKVYKISISLCTHTLCTTHTHCTTQNTGTYEKHMPTNTPVCTLNRPSTDIQAHVCVYCTHANWCTHMHNWRSTCTHIHTWTHIQTWTHHVLEGRSHIWCAVLEPDHERKKTSTQHGIIATYHITMTHCIPVCTQNGSSHGHTLARLRPLNQVLSIRQVCVIGHEIKGCLLICRGPQIQGSTLDMLWVSKSRQYPQNQSNLQLLIDLGQRNQKQAHPNHLGHKIKKNLNIFISLFFTI